MYHNSSGFGTLTTPAVKNLLLATIAVFLIQDFIAPHLDGVLVWLLPENYHSTPISPFALVFGVVPYIVATKFYLWQLFTYMFLHGDFFHILFNMFILWMFGCELERSWGTREFIKYYFLTGVIAGVSIVLWNIFWGNPYVPTIGASGAIFGILIAYAMFFPDREIYLYFLFPIKSKYFVLILGFLEFMALPKQDNISHIGHLGGLIAGFFYLRHRYAHWGIGQNFFKDFFKKRDRF